MGHRRYGHQAMRLAVGGILKIDAPSSILDEAIISGVRLLSVAGQSRAIPRTVVDGGTRKCE